MMELLSIVLAAVLAQAPQVETLDLQENRRAGELTALSQDGATLRTNSGDVRIPLAELMEIRFPVKPPVAPSQTAVHVQLATGSQFTCEKFTANGTRLQLEGLGSGTVSIPRSTLSTVRFGQGTGKLGEAWEELLKRKYTRDMLVVRKGDVLDHYDGVVGEVDAKSVRFLLDGDEVAVNRDRVYGLIIFRRAKARLRTVCRIDLGPQESLNASSVKLNGDQITATIAPGTDVSIPTARIRALDFSGGKLTYLSALEPRDVKYVPFFDITWKFRRDRNLDGKSLRLGGKTYRRGLSIHSRTLLRYRLAGEFTRFRAMMGIDQSILDGLGNVHVVIKGDDKVLLEADVKGTDEPRPVDLKVDGVRDLEILVDFGGDLDIGDHLDLADARLYK